MSGTHEDCGKGHQKPKGRDCGICSALAGGLAEAVEANWDKGPDAAGTGKDPRER